MERYKRQIILPGFGEIAQQKLAHAKVLVIGAGGLGCPVLQYLCASGIGQIGVVDFDIVSISNLHRQVLFHEKDVGRKKVDVIRKKLASQNSRLNIRAYECMLSRDNAFELVAAYDIIVDCTDNFASRYLLNDVCYLLKKPLVYASIFRFEGQLSVFHYGENPRNLRDLFPDIPNPASVPSCNEAGVIGVLTGIMGNFQANEVIKIITGIGQVTSGNLLVFDSLNYKTLLFQIPSSASTFKPEHKDEILKRSYDYTCENLYQITDLIELEHLIKHDKTILIDVRNPHEFPRITKYNLKEMPLHRLGQNLEQLESFETLIFICQSGIRSLKAIETVRKQYPEKKYFNIKNGIALFQK